MVRVNELDNLVDHGSLKGSIFRAKMMSARRLRGLGSFGLAGVLYAKFTPLMLMLGPTVPTLGIVGSLIYGATSFGES